MSEKNLPSTVVERDEPRELKGERVERTQELHPGRYWKAKKDIKEKGAKEPYIDGGCVLLLKRIKRVDDKPHAIELAGHPLISKGHTFTFLVQDFLNLFEPEPRGAEIRAEEMARLRAEIDEKQRDLLEFTSNPSKMLEHMKKHPALPKPETSYEERAGLPTAPFDPSAGLPGPNFRPSTSFVALAGGVDQEQQALLRRQAENQAILAKTRADLINNKTTAIAETVSKMTPFYEEQGAVALAQAEDALDMFKKLKSGIATLGLYTGSDVELTPIREGEGAPADEPIYVLQALMYMDEESLINISEGGADVRHFADFVEQLKTDDALLKRLIPFQRGLIGMRYVHEQKFYEGMDAWQMAMMNNENSRCFLILKNGERVTIIHSSLERFDRLFPTQSDIDQPFTRPGWFRGIESEDMTVEDFNRITQDHTDFSEARAKFDALVLHYRRLLIMLAGIHDRERDVIGEIAALSGRSGLAMLSLPMQEAIFRPVSDEERALGDGRPFFWDWVKEKNDRAQPGSRLLCNWRKLMTADTAPASVTRGERSDFFRYDPIEKFSVAIARRERDELYVDVQVKGHTRKYEDREFSSAVNVSKFDDHGLGYLCLDDVTPEEIEYYIKTRHERRGYIHYAPLLLAARDLLRKDRAHEAPLRRALVDALQAGARSQSMTPTTGIKIDGAEDSGLISTVIRQWRAAHRGAPTPSGDAVAGSDWLGNANVRSMLDQLWVLAGHGRDRKAAAEEIAAAEGRAPLRLSLSGKSALYLYTTSTDAEREELLGPHKWACRLTLEERKTKVTVTERRQVALQKTDARETVIAEWPGVDGWIDPEFEHALDYDQVRALRTLGDQAVERARRWLGPRSEETFQGDLSAVRADTRERSTRYITHGAIFFPLAIARETRVEERWDIDEKKRRKVESHTYHVGGLVVRAVDALWANGTKKQRTAIEQWFKDYYRDPTAALNTLGSDANFESFQVNHVPSVMKTTFCSARLGSNVTKAKSWDADARKFLQSIKEAYSKPRSAEMVIRFDAVAEEVYSLLKGKR